MSNKYLGTLTSTGTSVNNSTTAVPFTIPKGASLVFQPDGVGYLLADSTSVTSSNGVKLSADDRFPADCGTLTTVVVSSNQGSVASWISSSGTTNCKVFERSSLPGQLSTAVPAGTSASSGSGVSSMAAVGSSSNANGASISGSTLTLQPASASYPGVITTGTQTITGAKTVSGSTLTVLSASAASQSPLIIKTTGVVGSGSLLSTNPEWHLQQFEGGIGAAELQFKHKSDEFTERSIMEVESTGTLATVNDDALRAHYESYTHGLQNGHTGAYKPVMRLSAYPYEQYQMGPPCSMAIAGDVTRSGTTVTVTLSTAAYEHGFSVGDPLYITGSESGWTKSEGTLTVASVTAWNAFTYTDASATATVNTGNLLYTIEPDCTIGRKTAKTVDIQVDKVANPSNYVARFAKTAITIPSSVTLTTTGPISVNGSVGTSGYVMTSQGSGASPQWAAASTGHTIQNGGSSLTQRTYLNFTGSGITATDNSGTGKTDVSLVAAASGVAGYVSTGTQTMDGNKTFSGTISASNLSGTNTGDVTIGASDGNGGLTRSGQVLSLVTNPYVTTKGDSAGTPGNATLNTWAGRSAIASGSSSCTITNSLLSSGGIVAITPEGADWGTGRWWVTYNYASHTFTVSQNTTPGGALYFNWILF